jgi:hypothetical protein
MDDTAAVLLLAGRRRWHMNSKMVIVARVVLGLSFGLSACNYKLQCQVFDFDLL